MLDDGNHEIVALHDLCSGHQALNPPTRVPISVGASQNLIIKRPGGASGPWNPAETPYMIEPLDTLGSRLFASLAFVGPAQTGKTVALGEGWLSHAVPNDPGDMLIIQMSKEKAREYSYQRIDRAIRNSPVLRDMLSPSAQDDNTHDKQFKNGMWLRIGWPTVTNLSSTSYRYVFITDYDRIDDDIDGEGDAFSLGGKRTTTFLSRGMCAVESSPGRPQENPNWVPSTPHEAPPTKGVLGIYNRSDRRRWYWQCPHCAEWFEATPGLGLFRLPPDEQLLDTVRTADLSAMAKEYSRVVCPHNGCVILPKFKNAMNLGGKWLRDGQRITPDGEIVGEPRSSSVAGFWLGGVAATYVSWENLILKYLQALQDYALTGSELTLQTTINTDQGMPYMSRLLTNASRTATDPAGRKETGLLRFVVPDEARFLVAAVDVQGGSTSRFVVQVHAIGPNLEQWLVDRYEIKESMREGMGGMAPLDPAAYAEDWDLLTERVVRSTYRTSVEDQELRVRLTVVDSGGEDGVTDKAYAWMRRVRRAGMGQRVMLVKGASTKTAPMIKETLVGARNSKEKGDIPLYLLNPNLLKDAVSTGLRRPVPGPNYIHFPHWLPAAFFDELQSEVRLPTGTWKQIRKRNESFDLCAYIRAGCLRLGVDRPKFKWDNAPAWARPLMQNSERVTREERRDLQANAPIPNAAPLEVRSSARQQRRVSRSAYLA